MLTAITNLEERHNAFNTLCVRLQDDNECGIYERRVQNAGPDERDVYWHRQARLWSVLRPLDKKAYWWCAYGLSRDYPNDQNALRVSVEINPTFARNFNLRCSGMFAQVPTGDTVFLCHKGKINGVTMDFFQRNYRGELTTIYVPHDRPKHIQAALIGPIEGRRLPFSIAEFARESDRIRNLANGAALVDEADAYAPEFQGRRRQYSLETTIAARADHGLVVNTLARQLVAMGYEPRNDQQRDLIVEHDCNNTTLLFEVKTDVSTTSIYQGIGQLMFNGQALRYEWNMVLVLPQAPDVNTRNRLDELGITVLTYSWHRHQPRFDGLDQLLQEWP